MAEAEKLTIADAENGYKAIHSLVCAFPNYPKSFTADAKTVQWNMVGTSTSIGLYPLPGAIYLRKYISGSYKAQLPFQIVYKTSITTNAATINAQTMLENLAKWLETCGIDFEDENMVLESIARQTPVFVIKQDEKTTEYAVNLQLIYSMKAR